VQTPVHEPFEHADETHGVEFVQAPLVEQVSTLFPAHRTAFGAQEPAQLPLTHA